MAMRHVIDRVDENYRWVDDELEYDIKIDCIVEFDDKEILLVTGDLRTAKTKRRMNYISKQNGLGYRVRSKNGTWTIEYQGKTYEFANVKIRLDRVTGELQPKN
jgi:hypothetical protein